MEVSDFLKTLLRSFLIQASWSFERMQTLGFAFAIEPALRKLYPERGEYETRLREHLEYFNTQPYCASFILGAVMRLEEARAEGSDTAADVSKLKSTLMAPLGALGDSFFWGALKPMAAVTAAAMMVTGYWWAPLLFLAVFNLWHVGLRTGMLFWGYASGGDAVLLLSRYNFTRMARGFKIITLTVLGGILGMMPLWRPELRIGVPAHGIPVAFGGLLATLVMVALLRRGGSPVKLMLGLAAISLILAYAGVV